MVKTFRDIRDKMGIEIQDMNLEQLRAYFATRRLKRESEKAIEVPEKFKISSLRGRVSKMSSDEIDSQMRELRSEWDRVD